MGARCQVMVLVCQVLNMLPSHRQLADGEMGGGGHSPAPHIQPNLRLPDSRKVLKVLAN